MLGNTALNSMEMSLTACFTVRILPEAQVIIHIPPWYFYFWLPVWQREWANPELHSLSCTDNLGCDFTHLCVNEVNTQLFLGNVFMECHIGHLLTIHLKDVGLIQLFIAVGMTGVIAHVNSCYLGDVEGIVFSKILNGTKDRKGALLFSNNILNTTWMETTCSVVLIAMHPGDTAWILNSRL